MAYETIQKLIDSGMTLTAYCHDPRCNHHAVLDLHKLRDRLGPDAPCMHDDIVPKLRCQKCGSKKVGIILAPQEGRAGVWDGTKPDAYPEGRTPKPSLYQKAKGL